MAHDKTDLRTIAARPVKVRVSPKVANDLKTFQAAQARILDILGCPGCTSGFDIEWQQINEFVIDPRGQVVNY